MRFKVSRHFICACVALCIAALQLAACGAPRILVKTPPAIFAIKDFSSATIAGEEIPVLSGQAIVMYADHLPQAGGSGDEAVSKAALKNQLKLLRQSPSLEKIPAIWGLRNHCTYTIYVDVYFIGSLRITVVAAQMTQQIIKQWRTDYQVANHYISENDIPCLAT